MESIENLNYDLLSKIEQIEKDLMILNKNMILLNDQLIELQRFAVKLTRNQEEIIKRISSWPYISV